MNINPITAFKKAQQKRKNKKNILSNGKVTLDDLTGVNDEYAATIIEMKKQKDKLPFTFRGLDQITSVWAKLGLKGANFTDKIIITSSSADFFAFSFRKFFNKYHVNAQILINPQGFPLCKIICLDKSKQVISQMTVDVNSSVFIIPNNCIFLTIKGVK